MKEEKVLSVAEWNNYVVSNDSVLLYFYSEDCGVCNSLQPKVISLVEEKFPKMNMVLLNAFKNRELAAQIRVLSIPGIVLYMDGKEVFRANGLIMMSDLERKIARPYNMMFG